MKKIPVLTALMIVLIQNLFSQTLLELSRDNKTDEVLALLKNGVKDTQDELGWNGLLWACKNENVILVKEFLKHGSDPCAYTTNSRQFPLLMAARVNKGSDIIKLLLETRAIAQINTFGHDGLSPLIAAAKNNNIEICQILLKHGALKYLKSEEGYYAWEYSTIPEIQELLKP
jgi:ankyrin repeat protein